MPWWSLGSFWVFGFMPSLPGGRCVIYVWLWDRRVHLGSVGRALMVFRFIPSRRGGRCVDSGPPLGVVWFFRVLWVRSSAHWGSSDSFGSFWRSLGVVVFIRVRWVHSSRHLALSGSFVFIEFISVRLWCLWVHSD